MPEIAKPNRKLLPTQFADAEYQRRDIIVRPEAGTALGEMLQPIYWAHVAKQMRQHDRIEVRPADGAWWAELLVRAVEPYAVRVHVLRHETFALPQAGGKPAAVPDGYEVKYRGFDKYCVIRLADNVVLHTKENSPEAAHAWLVGHLAMLGEKAA